MNKERLIYVACMLHFKHTLKLFIVVNHDVIVFAKFGIKALGDDVIKHHKGLSVQSYENAINMTRSFL